MLVGYEISPKLETSEQLGSLDMLFLYGMLQEST